MMNLRRCKEGHYYDADKYTVCPHCNPTVSSMGTTMSWKMDDIPQKKRHTENPGEISEGNRHVRETDPEDEMFTMPLRNHVKQGSGDDGKVLKQEMIFDPDKEQDLGKTVSFYQSSLGTEPVVGWLVCINGNCYGKSFPLYSGRSYIGRDQENDVILAGDMSVCRKRHAAVVYDVYGNCFIAQQGEANGLLYLNGQVLLGNQLLKAYDILTVGKEKLLFIPLCGNSFSWADTKQGGKKAEAS